MNTKQMHESTIDSMVDAFLSWPLPRTVSPDSCIGAGENYLCTGTHLLSALEAKAMFRHVLESLPEPPADQQDVIRRLYALQAEV